MNIKFDPNHNPDTELSRDMKEDLVYLIEEKDQIFICINCKLNRGVSTHMGPSKFLSHIQKHKWKNHRLSPRTLTEILRFEREHNIESVNQGEE